MAMTTSTAAAGANCSASAPANGVPSPVQSSNPPSAMEFHQHHQHPPLPPQPPLPNQGQADSQKSLSLALAAPPSEAPLHAQTIPKHERKQPRFDERSNSKDSVLSAPATSARLINKPRYGPRSTNTNIQCYQCRKFGHKFSECPSSTSSYGSSNGNSRGNHSSHGSNSSHRPRRVIQSTICHKCNETGHIAPDYTRKSNNYSHNHGNLKSQSHHPRILKPCRYWMNGHCRQGDECQFLHGTYYPPGEGMGDNNALDHRHRDSRHRMMPVIDGYGSHPGYDIQGGAYIVDPSYGMQYIHSHPQAPYFELQSMYYQQYHHMQSMVPNPYLHHPDLQRQQYDHLPRYGSQAGITVPGPNPSQVMISQPMGALDEDDLCIYTSPILPDGYVLDMDNVATAAVENTVQQIGNENDNLSPANDVSSVESIPSSSPHPYDMNDAIYDSYEVNPSNLGNTSMNLNSSTPSSMGMTSTILGNPEDCVQPIQTGVELRDAMRDLSMVQHLSKDVNEEQISRGEIVGNNYTAEFGAIMSVSSATNAVSVVVPSDPGEKKFFIRGLKNPNGKNSCFLNAVVQALFNLKEFQNLFFSVKQHHCDGKENCVYCALRLVFEQLSNTSENSLVSTEALQNVLSNASPGKNSFSIGSMNDAAEAHESILWALHNTIVGNSSASKNRCSLPNFINHAACEIHESFGMYVKEIAKCLSCGEDMKALEYDTLVLYMNTNLLLNQIRHSEEKDFGKLLTPALVSESKKCSNHKCPNNKLIPATILLNLLPRVATLGFTWSSCRPTSDDLSSILNHMTSEIDFSRLLPLSDVTRLHSPPAFSIARLSGMICYFGHHYVTYSYNSNMRLWFFYDDATVKPMGEQWDSIVKDCLERKFQPLLLFYQPSDVSKVGNLGGTVQSVFQFTVGDILVNSLEPVNTSVSNSGSLSPSVPTSPHSTHVESSSQSNRNERKLEEPVSGPRPTSSHSQNGNPHHRNRSNHSNSKNSSSSGQTSNSRRRRQNHRNKGANSK